MFFENFQQAFKDRYAHEVKLRWLSFAIVMAIYVLRVLIKDSHYIITYAVGIYLVQGFIFFATPKMKNTTDPFETLTEEQIEEEKQAFDGPFIRSLPEFEFWLFYMKVVLVSFGLTFIKFLDIPVFAPLLVVYFMLMVFATLYKLKQHQKLYNYNPWRTISSYKKDEQ